MKNKVVSRRQFAVAGVMGVGAAALAGMVKKQVSASNALAATPLAKATSTAVNEAASVDGALMQDLHSLIAPFSVNSAVVGSTLTGVHIDERRRGVLTLTDRKGDQFLVDVARRSSGSKSSNAIFSTNQYSLYLRNGADGSTRTNEQQGLALMALGDVIGFNEKKSAPLPLISKEKQWALEKKQQG